MNPKFECINILNNHRTCSQTFQEYLHGNYRLQYLQLPQTESNARRKYSKTFIHTSSGYPTNQNQENIENSTSCLRLINYEHSVAAEAMRFDYSLINLFSHKKHKSKTTMWIMKQLPALIEGSTVSRSTAWSCPNLQKLCLLQKCIKILPNFQHFLSIKREKDEAFYQSMTCPILGANSSTW